MDETGDMGGIPEAELIRRGLVADVLTPYKERLKQQQKARSKP